MATQLQLRNGTIQEWVDANPILGEAEMGIITDSNAYVIGDGKTRYIDLLQMPFGKGVYEVLVQYGYKGTRADFCRQLDLSLKNPEQQVGTLSNAGPGWNSFTFPKEFSEDVYITLTAQNAAVFGVLKNITRKGFHYCLYDAAGDTVGENVVVNYIAVASSELNLAQAIAQSAGLNPFDFDNLTDLFTGHAAEVVGSGAAFNLTKRSGMASGRYICHLTGLNPVTYHNIVSLAGDVTAMNTIAVTEEALTFIVMSPAAYDSIRLSSMAMSKYLAGLLSLAPADYSTVTDLLNDSAALTALVASPVAMQALCASEVASKEMVVHEAAASAVAASSVAMTAVAASSVAMTAVAASSVAYMSIYNSSDAYAILLQTAAAVLIIANDRAAVEAMINTEGRCTLLASSATAMSAVASSATAMSAVASSATAMSAVASSALARESLWDSPDVAMLAINKVDMAIAKYAVGCLNSSSIRPESYGSMSSIVAAPATLAALASSSVAMAEINKSTTAKTALYNAATKLKKTNGDTWQLSSNSAMDVHNGKGVLVRFTQPTSPGGSNGVYLDGVNVTGNVLSYDLVRVYNTKLGVCWYYNNSELAYIKITN